MADRDRYDWDRGRDVDRDRDRDRDYGRGGSRGYDDRGMMSRGADEVRSWFGDDEARRRREMDEQRERTWRDRERDYGANSERARSEHGWSGQQRPDTPWESGRGGSTGYGDQRDFVGRSNDWSGSQPSYNQGSHWTGGARDYGDEDSRRRYGNWQYTGGFSAGQPSSSFSGGYGTGNYESNSSRGRGPGHESSSPQTMFRRSASSEYSGGYSSSAPGGYGREEYGTTGEGRWSGQQFNRPDPFPGTFGGAYSSGGYMPGSFSGRGPRNYQRSDERVREDVSERLTIDPRIDASDIDVHVQNGEVTLSGMVDDRRTRRLAEEMIEDLPGVRDVRNELRVNRGQDWGQGDAHRHVGEESRKHEDGSIGNTGNPQRRDDVTTVNVKEGTKR